MVDAMKKYMACTLWRHRRRWRTAGQVHQKAELIAYEDLGAEALRNYVEDMPLVVIIDSEGNNLYEQGRKRYLENR